MTSTTTGSPALATSTPPTPFSYAQAAKGHKTPTLNASVAPSQATSGISTPAKDATSINNTPSASIDGAATGSEAGDKSVNGSLDSAVKNEAPSSAPDTDAKSVTVVNSESASPSIDTASTATLPREEELSLPAPVVSEGIWERNSHSANAANKPTEAPDARRGKKGKKQKNAEKEAEREEEREAEKEREEAERKLLVAAPLPTVNPWLQRQESLAQKVKPSPATNTNSQNQESTSAEATGKPADSKKKAKAAGGDDADKSQPQSGATKDGSNKTPKKSVEGAAKAKEDTSKRVGPRGSRVSEKENDKAVTSQSLPPPVEDPTLWPTPETALEEERRKAQEKEKAEKNKEARDESSANKPRAKATKWDKLPYVPTVEFKTQLPPSRGGRGRGGARTAGRDSTGRGNHSLNGAANDAGSAVGNHAAEVEARGRGASTGNRSSSLPPSKRTTNDAYGNGKPVSPSLEKAKSGQAKNGTSLNVDSRQTLTNGHNEKSGENQKVVKPEELKGVSKDGVPSSAGERRGDIRSEFKDNPNSNNGQVRERADNRADRGRGGGFRGGRGGHNGFTNGQPQTYTNTNGAPMPNGYPRQGPSPYSPGMPPAPFSNQYSQAPSRGGRGGGSRSQTIPNAPVFPRFAPNGGPQLPPLQMPNSMYDYPGALQTMSAMPYGPSTPDTFQIVSVVKMQVEYYFSIDNLCKDLFLRKHMDSQGFVFLSVLVNFKRIQQLFQGQNHIHEFDLMRMACFDSQELDLVTGEDGIDRVRRMDGWDSWVLEIADRDESARNGGPVQLHRPDPREKYQYGPPQPQPQHFFPNGADSRIYPVNGLTSPRMINGNGYHDTPVQLAGGAADFTPSGFVPAPVTNGSTPYPVANGSYVADSSSAVDRLQGETTFSDERVSNLRLIFRSPKSSNGDRPVKPYHGASSRTFSNGSIDGTSIAEEIASQGTTNGIVPAESSPDDERQSRSHFGALSPTISTSTNGPPPVMWLKEAVDQAPVSEDDTEEAYTSLLAKALKSRALPSTTGEINIEMKHLYDFWSHFLCRNFNPKMYADFRNYAHEDAEKEMFEGKESLISYYEATLASKRKVIPDALAEDYVQLVKDEQKQLASSSPSERPAFKALRTQWRNGALDLKSRKKIGALIDVELTKELES